MFKNKILFIFKRYKYNDNKVLTLKDLFFLSITLFIIIIKSSKLIIKNELNENNFDIDSLKNISNKKKLTSIFRVFKKRLINEFNLINIIKINALIYYYLT